MHSFSGVLEEHKPKCNNGRTYAGKRRPELIVKAQGAINFFFFLYLFLLFICEVEKYEEDTFILIRFRETFQSTTARRRLRWEAGGSVLTGRKT